MKIGFGLPQFHKQAFDIEQVAQFAREVESAGGASLWVGDRNLAPVHPRIGYGGQGNTIPAELNSAADPFVLLGVAASATKRVLLGSHVLVAPLYPTVQLARSLTTIDVISGGRLLPGFGIGWSPEEYEAAGLNFTTRGKRMDEVLDALHAIWTSDPSVYQGEHVSVPLHHSPLKPARQPRPPFYLGAMSERALLRVAKRGDGWLPLCTVPSWLDVDDLVRQQKLLGQLMREAGRDPSSIDSVLRVNIDPGTSSDEVAKAIRTVQERTGIEHFLVDTLYSEENVDQSLQRATEILARVQEG